MVVFVLGFRVHLGLELLALDSMHVDLVVSAWALPRLPSECSDVYGGGYTLSHMRTWTAWDGKRGSVPLSLLLSCLG